MILRTGNVNITSAQGNLQPGTGYKVTVLPAGGIASANSSANVITMGAGHGFVAGEKIMVGADEATFSGSQSIQSVTATTITFTSGVNFNVVVGDTIINLGVDTGTSQPNYDGSTVTIYSDPAGATAISNEEVTVNEGGEYSYYHNGATNLWEVVRSSNNDVGAVGYVKDAYTTVLGTMALDGLTVTGTSTMAGITSSGTIRRSVSAAVTASTTHTQVGGTVLTSDINNVSVCANTDDAVTLPTAVAGMTIVVINNGAQDLRIWPASGDNLGTGVDTVRGALAAGSNVCFVSYNATNWEEI